MISVWFRYWCGRANTTVSQDVSRGTWTRDGEEEEGRWAAGNEDGDGSETPEARSRVEGKRPIKVLQPRDWEGFDTKPESLRTARLTAGNATLCPQKLASPLNILQ